MILKFFDIFLKMKDLSSSEAFMVTAYFLFSSKGPSTYYTTVWEGGGFRNLLYTLYEGERGVCADVI